jgi:hypothetical protein
VGPRAGLDTTDNLQAFLLKENKQFEIIIIIIIIIIKRGYYGKGPVSNT